MFVYYRSRSISLSHNVYPLEYRLNFISYNFTQLYLVVDKNEHKIIQETVHFLTTFLANSVQLSTYHLILTAFKKCYHEVNRFNRYRFATNYKNEKP